MVPFELRKHRHLLASAEGLSKLVDEQIAESDHLDYKLLYTPKAPDYKNTVRIDGGALATSGEGYLVIGVEDSRDNRNVAKSIPGLPVADAASLAASIEDLLGSRIDPPIVKRQCRIVHIGADRAVLVVMVRGRKRYPVGIEQEKEGGGALFYVRERGKNVLLRLQDARLRRRDLNIWRRIVPVAALILLALFFAIGVLARRVNSLQARRELTGSSRSTLMSVLSLFPGNTVRIGSVLGDPESQIYADQYAVVFREAGWNVRRELLTGVEAVGVVLVGGEAGEAGSGCLVRYNTPLHRVAYALRSIGEGILVCRPMETSENPLLMIGRNPEGPAARQLLDANPQQEAQDWSMPVPVGGPD